MAVATQKSNQLNLTVVALVALVAIVGLVALVLNAASLATISENMKEASSIDDVTVETDNVVGDAVNLDDVNLRKVRRPASEGVSK